ncbi:MAG: hypothetical protein A2452_04935 [Candidatus Firestonebacteria bacterium RIFOXYC2_FULL_39_67]|nr:MAG: hypothetical protein A2536_11470 [Candidatus Firestonebacteria bacterium RIFOXYD2_FULL_39_29]OGF55821.1 MAG: hypothetical protein A2452_04935 [Candidatus Firestonebacteria bacterium RIFOXYC2_FULL_39_67]
MKYLKKDDLTGRQYVFACFFITAIILIVYGRWINNYFSGDDFFGITSVIKMRMNFLSCVERYSWLMSSLSSYIDMLIFGINPAGYNITNIILHVLNVLMLGLVVLLVSNNKVLSLLVMFFYGLSAQGIEAIAWISGRGHSTLMLFILLTIAGFIYYRKTKKIIIYYISIFFALLAHLALFNAVIIPVLLMLYVLLFNNKPFSKKNYLSNIKILLPYFMITAAYIIIYLFVKNTQSISSYYKFDMSIPVQLGKNIFDYIDFMYLNYRIFDYNSNSVIVVSIIVLIAYFSCLLLIKDKMIRFGLFWMLITLIPYLPVPTVKYFQYSRYRYIPVAGFAIIISAVVMKLYNMKITSGKKNLFKYSYKIIAVSVVLVYALSNVYYIDLEEQGYKTFGDYHKQLVNKIMPLMESVPKDKMVVYVNSYYFNGPKYMQQYHLIMPRLLFVRSTGPLGLVYIEDLLTFCKYDTENPGVYVQERSKEKVFKCMADNNYTGIQFTEKGFSFFQLNKNRFEDLKKDWGKSGGLPENVIAVKWEGK